MDQDVLIDSNVYIGLLRSGRDPAEAIYDRYETTDVVTCGMVKLEVLRGMKVERAYRKLDEIFSLMQYVVSDNSLWEEATKLAWTLDRQGKTIPAQDAVIAACALRVDAAVHSFDRHFQWVPGLEVFTDPL
jgi:predicted nucleic acid-binding protein